MITEKKKPKKLYHVPVMLKECVDELIKIPTEGWIIDGTYGDGGHSRAIFDEILPKYPKLGLISIDWDFSGYDAKKTHEGEYPTELDDLDHKDRWVIAKDNFVNVVNVVKKSSDITDIKPQIAGMLLDLGISSRQYVQKERGFSFKGNTRADMRMNKELYAVAAYDLLNNLPYKGMKRMFMALVGMPEFMAAALSKEIILRREEHQFGNRDDIARLNDIAYKVKPIRKNSQGRIHPATLLFLALRIAVNTELQNIQEVLPNAYSIATRGTKFLIMTYHSSEEDVVESFLSNKGIKASYILPSPKEIRKNPRSRSAKLYVFQS